MSDHYETSARVEDGILDLNLGRALWGWPDGPVHVTIERPDPQRNSAQNRYLHGVVIPLLASHCGYSLQEMKAALALQFLPRTVRDLDGLQRTVPGHTSDLSVKEFTAFLEACVQLAAELGVVIPDPVGTK